VAAPFREQSIPSLAARLPDQGWSPNRHPHILSVT
jgi:hypothetical protein